MKSLVGFVCIILIAVCAILATYTVQTEVHADRWNERVTSLEHVEALNMDLVRAMEYVELSMDATRMLAHENVVLVQREAKMAEVVAAFEEENRSLKNVLSESVGRLETQLGDINDLIDENEKLVDKINELRDQASDLKKQISTLERAIDKLTEIAPLTIIPDGPVLTPSGPTIIDILLDEDGNPVKGPE